MKTEKQIIDKIEKLEKERDDMYSGKGSYDRFMRTALNNRINQLNWVLKTETYI